MNRQLLLFVMILISSCASQEKLAYLGNFREAGLDDQLFKTDLPEYKIQYRDILYITIRSMTVDGTIKDFLSNMSGSQGIYSQNEAGQYMFGYDVGKTGEIILPVLGTLNVEGKNLEEARTMIQERAGNHFNNATVECKLLSYKFTVIGEVRSPGTYVNYNNYLTIFEAIGRAGGITDFGRRDKILVLRPVPGGTNTFNLNLQNKSILTSKAYFLLPNDVVIVEPGHRKIFNLNLPTFSFILSSITTTLLLINYLSK
jgi:polysaccharide biosynthesis/export protein